MILLTGATGTVGTEVVSRLRAVAAPFRILARDPAAARARLGPDLDVREGDLAVPATLDAALDGADAVLLLSSAHPRQTEFHRNLIEAMKRGATRRLVKISALGADPKSRGSITRWHGQTDVEIAGSGLEYTILRPHVFMQNLLASAEAIRATGMLHAAVADARVAPIDVRDVAECAVRILTQGGRGGTTLNLTGGELLTYADMASKLSKAIGRTVTYVPITYQDFKRTMLDAKAPEWYANALIELFQAFVAGHGAIVTEAVAEITGHAPITFDAFAKDHSARF